jgi:D-beta-D-heptose 7-phosphate kinase/D-beta-D-heptose 1-phosphate adenosyltransferase
MCDTYLSGHVSRISPEAPVPVFESIEKRHVLGGAANVAANLRALGCQVRLVGAVGDDITGRYVREQVRAQGMADDLLMQDAERPTTEKTRLIARRQQLVRLDQESRLPLPAGLIARALSEVESILTEVDGLVCSDYDKGVCTPALLVPLFAKAKAANLPIFVDPKARDFARYRGATVLTPNLAEVRHATGDVLEDDTSLAAAAESLLRQSEAQALLVTRGEAGMSLFHPPKAPRHLPAHTRDVYDVTGAGDTVVAAFAAAAIGGLSYAEAARLANVAAGIVVGKAGTAVVHREELESHLEAHNAPWQSKLRTRDELSTALQQHRQRGDRVVFTNGCFDLLHGGHVHYLQQARALGDCLVVALNDDASVRLLKGDERPLRPQDERARVLAALACVDYLVLFGEATPLALIKSLRPDVLVKGGDYTLATVVGREEVEASGGSVHLIPYIEGVSTTELVTRIVQRAP